MTPTPAQPAFARWAQGFSGCDGGDLGSPQQPSLWFCGIEWGGTRDAEALARQLQCDVQQPPAGYPHWEHNTRYRFNQQAAKLLACMAGYPLQEYRAFLAQHRPFCEGSGYFKLNLLPIAFKDTSHHRWQADFAALTGLPTKRDYLDWCLAHRLPALREQAARQRPRLILCVGKTYVEYFKAAFLDNHEVPMQRASIDGHELLYKRNAQGTLVAVIPFMLNRHGLVRHASIAHFGQAIAALLNQA